MTTTLTLARGTRVRLVTDNPYLHGAAAVVETPTHYGAVVRTTAAATGRFRALHTEMVPDGGGAPPAPSGDVCDTCGSVNMTRAGPCLVCLACGSTSGGCS